MNFRKNLYAVLALSLLTISAGEASAQSTLENTLLKIRQTKSMTGSELQSAGAGRTGSVARINELKSKLEALKKAEKEALEAKLKAAEEKKSRAKEAASINKFNDASGDTASAGLESSRFPGVSQKDYMDMLGSDAKNNGTAEIDFKALITSSTEVDPKHGEPLKLIECINTAKEKSPAILESFYNLSSQANKIEQSKAPLKPQVNLSGQESWQSSDTKTGAGVSTNSNASSGSLSVSANKVVYDGNKLRSGVAIAEKNEQVADLNHKKLILDTLLKVTENYYNAIINIKLEIVQKENYRSAVMHEELADANFNVGISPKTDLIRAQANTYNNKYNLITAKNNIKKSKLALELSMGIMATEEIWLLDSLVCDTFDIELKASVEKAMGVRQEIAAQKEAIEILKIQKKQIAAERAPQFSIGTSAGKSFENSQKTDRGSFSVYGNVSLSLYNGGLTANKLAEIDQKLKAEEQKFNSLSLSVKYDVTQAYLTLTEAFEKIEVAKKSVEAAELSKKLTEEQYKVGLATMIDLLDAEVAFSTALTNMIQAQGSFLIARCRFKRSIGEDEFYK